MHEYEISPELYIQSLTERILADCGNKRVIDRLEIHICLRPGRSADIQVHSA